MGDKPDLASLRQQIDRIDEKMHELLIERGSVVAGIKAAKRGAETGSAFRPEREASMMRAIEARHDGVLPLATVEHIWREIIGTFTQMQAAFSIHVARGNRTGMHDMARFYFGFATPLVEHGDTPSALDALIANLNDLALVPANATRPWWHELDPRLRVIARFPFFDFPPSITPEQVLVVGDARIDPPEGPALFAISLAQGATIPVEFGETVSQVSDEAGAHFLLSSEHSEAALSTSLAPQHLQQVGSYAKASSAAS